MNSRRKLVVALGVSVAAVMTLLGYQLWSSYQESLSEAETKTRNYAAILETRLDATLRRADGDLRDLASRLPVAALSKQAVPRYAREIDAHLDLHMIGFEELAGMRVFDTDGDLIYTSNSKTIPRTNVIDRDYSFFVTAGVAREDVLAGWKQRSLTIGLSALLLLGLLIGLMYRLSHAEATLKSSEELMRSTFEQAAVGIAHIAPDSYRILKVNEKFCQLLGYSRDELTAMDSTILVSPDQMPAREAARAQLIAGEIGSSSCKRRFIRKDGSMLWVNRSLSLVRDPAGQPEYFISVIEDTTKRKRVEDALRASEEKFSKAFHASPDSITLSKLETSEFVEVNEGFVRISGYSREEAIGRTAIELGLWTQTDQRAELIARLFAGKQVHSLETVLSRKDGAKRVVLISLEIIDLGGEKYMLTIGRDVTEPRQAEDEIRRLNETLEQKVKERTLELEHSNEELAAFSYSVAHDLRAPLRGINGFSAILADEYVGKLDAMALGYLERIRVASVHMGDVMDDLLALAHAGRAELQRQEVDLSAMAQAIAANLRSAAPQRRVEFVITPGLMASADPGLMRIALDNLFGNAWKFSAKTEGAKIEFGLTTAEGQLAYFVRDNGAGFDPAYSSKLFEQFQRLHTDKEYEGTGVGLAIVARVIRRHGGRIWAEGAVGRGATFHFTLG
jgi:PAS domain S-box-containing protein